ncbi:DUF6165 family protein [Alphaproteobacteria bacterium]|nr:DUF6165 family protein [Alphaproteobacteria bacterium]
MPVSLGELIDKISILEIKKKNIEDKDKLNLIDEELLLLKENLSNSVNDKKIHYYMDELFKINSKLWKIEDDIRDCERKKQFDQNFIHLARSVYFTNDQRSKIKLDINSYFGSQIIEVKSYEKY